MTIQRNDPCWCGSEKKWKKCHYPLPSPASENQLAAEYRKRYGILIKTPEQIEGIKGSCKLAAKILDTVCAHAKKGVTTNELEKFAHHLYLEAGSIPATLGYGSPPFPKTICTSLNEVICHGIPDDRPLQEGDILNIDVTCILNGYYGDCSKMVMIGKVSEEKERVVKASYDALMRAIAILKPGTLLHSIGDTIEACAKEYGCSVVDAFVAHGVGVDFHEPPQIPHHKNRLAIPLVEGMTFTIEPMINAGKKGAVIDANDQWTARTEDGRASAQWEHTLLITKNGHEILTLL